VRIHESARYGTRNKRTRHELTDTFLQPQREPLTVRQVPSRRPHQHTPPRPVSRRRVLPPKGHLLHRRRHIRSLWVRLLRLRQELHRY
jgi:hypothetical protein